MPTVVISTYLEPELVDRVAAVDPSVSVRYEPRLLPRPRYVADHGGVLPQLDDAAQREWERLLADADIAFDFDWQAPQQLPRRAPNLKWVQATSAGIGAFMTRTGLAETELVVTTAAGIHAVPLAEFALTAALHFVKDVPRMQREQAAHHWQRYTGEQLAGRAVTVVGLGGMGRQVVHTFAALGTQVTAVGRPGGSYDLPDGVRLCSTDDLDDVLPATDVLVLCTALTAQTDRLINRARVESLPPTAVVVNISRGQVIDEAALVEALRTRSITGAALDVFTAEPLPADSPLWELDNVLVSPHSASTVAGENAALTDLFTDNIARWLDGRPLRNLFRRELGY